jgi:hypothetical protein
VFIGQVAGMGERGTATGCPDRLTTRTRERHAAVRALRERGATIPAFAVNSGVDRRPARRLARAGQLEDLLGKPVRARVCSMLSSPNLRERFTAAHTEPPH